MSHSLLEPASRTPLTDILIEQIRREGPMTFAAFMEACLYHSEHGYYTRWVEEPEGADYLTSPELSALFGELLSWQLREMWERLGEPAEFHLVDCGGGRGRLLEQIFSWANRQDSEFARALRMVLVERSAARLEQAGQLLPATEVQRRLDLPAGGVVGCLLSNELLDAMPVHRVVQRAEGPREIYVGEQSGELGEMEGQPSTPELGCYLERFGVRLAQDQFAEINLAALAWLEQAARALERGFLLTIDYGYRARELYGPAHQRGTLLAYREHRTSEDWLSQPGEQDLTAQVNFTALEERGWELGLVPLGYLPQAQFLLALGRASGLVERLEREAETSEARATRNQLKQLIHPEGMGEAFKVLLQGKGVDTPRLDGFQPL